MNRFLAYIFLVLLMVSCDNINKPKKPDNLISKEKMSDIIVDISLMNAAKGIDKKILERNNINPEGFIFEKHNIDSLQFAESSNYYAYNIKAYEAIYKEAKRKLEARKIEWSAKEETKRNEQDSIRKLKQEARKAIKDSILKEGKKPQESLSRKILRDKVRFQDRSRTTEKLPEKSPE